MKLKAILLNILKIAVVAGLFTWMIRDDKLQLDQLAFFLRDPQALAVTLSAWFVSAVMIGTYRWYLLLRGAGVECSYPRALVLQMIGFFFNTSMPGAVSGDIIKAVYIVKDQKEAKGKTPAMLSVLLDRIVGLFGLFIMGGVACLFQWQKLWSQPSTRSLCFFLIVALVVIIAFLAIVYWRHAEGRDPFRKLLDRNLPGCSLFLKVYDALRSYRNNPWIIAQTIGLSIAAQLCYLLYMWYCSGFGEFERADLGLLAAVFPFGILVTAIPVAPGGLGVGHMAFEKLFLFVGLKNGANVFNLYAVGTLLLNLLGVIPYLLSGVKKNSEETATAEEAICR